MAFAYVSRGEAVSRNAPISFQLVPLQTRIWGPPLQYGWVVSWVAFGGLAISWPC